MPPPVSPATAGAPSAPPAAAPQPPFGGSPAVSPTPNPGYEAAGRQKLAIALKVLQDALPLYGASSEQGQTILKVMQDLGKLAQPGDVSQTGQMSQLQQMMLKAQQSGQQQKQLAQQPPQGGQAAAA